MLKGNIKRIFLAFLVIITLSIVAVFVLIPAQVNITRSVTIHCTKNGANKILGTSVRWQEWWPAEDGKNFEFNDIVYAPILPAKTSYNIFVYKGTDTFKTTLNILTADKDSVLFLWNATANNQNNPLKRFTQYQTAKTLANDMDSLLKKLKVHLEESKNVYGIHIDYGRVKDTLLISTKRITTHTPNTEEIYALINKLNNAITINGAKATNYPMLNITNPDDSEHFLVQVAIPINKIIKETNDITIKRMVAGNILITNEITGGNYTVKKAFEKVNAYVADFNRIVPAIPFQSLITNRMEQPDTSKWITKIYCPVY